MLFFLKLKELSLFLLLMVTCISQGYAFNNSANQGPEKRNALLDSHLFHRSADFTGNSFDKLSRQKKKNRFQLKEIEGRWVARSESIGGVDGGTGVSILAEGVFSFDKFGRGTVHYFNSVLYDGDNSVQFFNFDSADSTISIKITDYVLGLANITVTNSFGEYILKVILIRNISTGQVIAMQGVNSGDIGFVASIDLFRQNIK